MSYFIDIGATFSSFVKGISLMYLPSWSGNVYPLGSYWDGKGTNFALSSENATGVELCSFDRNDQENRLFLAEVSNFIWHGYDWNSPV